MSASESGFYAQGGYLFSNNVEMSARYGQIIPASENTSLSGKSEVGVALSRYIGSHSMKVQGDVFRRWSDDGFSEGDTELRIQMQMAY